MKPAFEFYYNVHGLFFKIFASGEVYVNNINGSDLGVIGTVINRIPHEAYKQEQIKMTRDEAITLTKDIARRSPSDHMIVLNILEALGLIKFDELPKCPEWKSHYKSMSLKTMVEQIVYLKSNFIHHDRGNRIDFLKAEIQRTLANY